jgi:hypothetical protein
MKDVTGGIGTSCPLIGQADHAKHGTSRASFPCLKKYDVERHSPAGRRAWVTV